MGANTSAPPPTLQGANVTEGQPGLAPARGPGVIAYVETERIEFVAGANFGLVLPGIFNTFDLSKTFMTVLSANTIIDTQVGPPATTAPSVKIGNNATHDNLVRGLPATLANYNAGAVPPYNPVSLLLPTQPVQYVPLSTPMLGVFITPAAGVLSLIGKLILCVWVFPSP